MRKLKGRLIQNKKDVVTRALQFHFPCSAVPLKYIVLTLTQNGYYVISKNIQVVENRYD